MESAAGDVRNRIIGDFHYVNAGTAQERKVLQSISFLDPDGGVFNYPISGQTLRENFGDDTIRAITQIIEANMAGARAQ